MTFLHSMHHDTHVQLLQNRTTLLKLTRDREVIRQFRARFNSDMAAFRFRLELLRVMQAQKNDHWQNQPRDEDGRWTDTCAAARRPATDIGTIRPLREDEAGAGSRLDQDGTRRPSETEILTDEAFWARVHDLSSGRELTEAAQQASVKALARVAAHVLNLWLRRPDVLSPSKPARVSGERTAREIIAPNGQPVGLQFRRTGSDTRTVSNREFDSIRSQLLIRSERIQGPATYIGEVYKRWDGTVFGLRISEHHGKTIDLFTKINDIQKIHFLP